jgi:hypothetical protein
MALIEVFHIVADEYPVASGNAIVSGMVCSLESGGTDLDGTEGVARVIPASHTGGSAVNVIGIAGDSSKNDKGHTPYSTNVVINATGGTRSTQDRVSDMYDETVSSGLITVYNSGGKFRTDQYDPTDATNMTPGTSLLVSVNSDGLIGTNAAGSNAKVGVAVIIPSSFPSGVPGTDIAGSISLGTFLTLKLTV